MRLAYTNSAIRTLAKLPVQQRQRIVTKISGYASDPASQANNVKKLKGRSDLRLRVGDYRIIFSIMIDTDQSETMTVTEIGHRSNIYD